MNNWTIDYGNDQHQGHRKEQQDFFASFEPSMKVVKSKSGFLAVVADGMGGHKGGAQASLIAINTFVKEYQQKDDNETIPEALNRSLIKANATVYQANLDAGPDSNMGTTLVAIVLKSNKLYWISVGDSSLFLLRNNKLNKLNEEHNYGKVLDRKVLSGQLSKAQADAESNKRNMLTSYLGIDEIPLIDLQKIPQDLQINDKIVVCSDGLVDALVPEEMISCLQSQGSSQDKSELLTKSALNKQRKNQDNITTIVVEINQKTPDFKISKEPNDGFKRKEEVEKKKKINFYLNLTIVFLFIVIATFSYFIYNKINGQIISQPDREYEQTSTESDLNNTTSEHGHQNSTDNNSTVPIDTQQGQNQDNKPKEDSLLNTQNDPYLYLKIQVVLREISSYQGQIDNEFGEMTKEALKTFQRIHNLDPTGVLDTETLAKMDSGFKKYKNKIQIEIDKFDPQEIDKLYILKVQCVLKELGETMYTGEIDNVTGTKTKEGIKCLQKAKELDVTGELNTKTKELFEQYFIQHKDALEGCINYYNTSNKSKSQKNTAAPPQNPSIQKSEQPEETFSEEPPVSEDVMGGSEYEKITPEDSETVDSLNTFTKHSGSSEDEQKNEAISKTTPDEITPSVKQ
ncbi:MAG: peptidoglycan-binding protein [Candidatus Magnetomorum sp.]|nr:peptidoglycan-binding protein [Candidatus Magnetomorum sp.]